MPRTVQIRDLDDDVYASLQRHAGEAGVSVPELLRQAAARIAARPTIGEWLARTAAPVERHLDTGRPQCIGRAARSLAELNAGR